MADYISNQRIVVGEGKERHVIEPGERFDPATAGISNAELQSLLQQTPPAVRVVDDPNAPPAPQPQPQPEQQQQQAQPESDTITRTEPEPREE